MAHHPTQDCNTSDNLHFEQVLAHAQLSRRNVIRGGVGLAAVAVWPSVSSAATQAASTVAKSVSKKSSAKLGFSAVGKSIADGVMLPPGYTFSVLHATGDRLVSGIPTYSNQGTELDDWSQRIGDHHDGMELFYAGRNGKFSVIPTPRIVLAMNHESSADAHFMHPKGQTSNGVAGKKFSQFGEWDLGARPIDGLEVLKEINHHGVSVVELQQNNKGQWSYILDSIYNRRITPHTPMRISAPKAHLATVQAMMVTAFDTTGVNSRGTLNNCGTGSTPWGTMLTCEENWAFYFHMPKGANPVDAKLNSSLKRYGVASAPLPASETKGNGQGWHTVSTTDNRFTRWNNSAVADRAETDFRNEPNTFGYIVEIDPLSSATPAKRVALGRFAHEAAVFGLPVAGKPLAVYSGDDARNEYIYKFVSDANWDPKDIGAGMAAGDKYLTEGRLYAAKFNADGTGQWLELSINDPRVANYSAYKFTNQADVLINSRAAADAVGATKMDRPEWGAVNPSNGEVYITLTNNSAANRTPVKTDAANPRAYADGDGKKGSGNPNGHIIRFREDNNTSTATGFKWDIFLFGAEEDMPANVNLSGLSANNSFSSPDGLWFSKATGICWIQTDDGAYTDETNCMLLAAIPGQVGDGGKVSVKNSMTVGGNEVSGTQETFIGATLGDAKLRRFLVAPKGAEVTGIVETADGKTLFVNIQHPGENSNAMGLTSTFSLESLWPGNQGYGAAGRPRSATIVITRKDGGVIGV